MNVNFLLTHQRNNRGRKNGAMRGSRCSLHSQFAWALMHTTRVLLAASARVFFARYEMIAYILNNIAAQPKPLCDNVFFLIRFTKIVSELLKISNAYRKYRAHQNIFSFSVDKHSLKHIYKK